MSCRWQTDSLIAQMLAGELGKIKKFMLLRHIRSCPQCRAHYKQTRALWDALGSTASKPAGCDLKNRIAAALPSPYESARRVKSVEEQIMRKKIAIAFALVFLLGTSIMAAQYFGDKVNNSTKSKSGNGTVNMSNSRGGGGYGGSSGRMPGNGPGGMPGGGGRSGGGGMAIINGHRWTISSSMNAQVKIIDPAGKTRITLSASAPGQTGGEVKLTVDSNEYKFDKIGKFEVVDPNSNELLGYVEIAAADSQEPQSPAGPGPNPGGGSSGNSGVKATKDGCEGFDQSLGITWKLRGAAMVTVKNATGNMMGMAASMPPNAPASPELTVQVGDKTLNYKGYGTFNIPDAEGKTVLTLIIEKPAPPR